MFYHITDGEHVYDTGSMEEALFLQKCYANSGLYAEIVIVTD